MIRVYSDDIMGYFHCTKQFVYKMGYTKKDFDKEGNLPLHPYKFTVCLRTFVKEKRDELARRKKAGS